MERSAVWGMFYAGLVSMQFHPGAGKHEHRPLSLWACAEIADAMLNEYLRRFPCRGPQ